MKKIELIELLDDIFYGICSVQSYKNSTTLKRVEYEKSDGDEWGQLTLKNYNFNHNISDFIDVENSFEIIDNVINIINNISFFYENLDVYKTRENPLCLGITNEIIAISNIISIKTRRNNGFFVICPKENIKQLIEHFNRCDGCLFDTNIRSASEYLKYEGVLDNRIHIYSYSGISLTDELIVGYGNRYTKKTESTKYEKMIYDNVEIDKSFLNIIPDVMKTKIINIVTCKHEYDSDFGLALNIIKYNDSWKYKISFHDTSNNYFCKISNLSAKLRNSK